MKRSLAAPLLLLLLLTVAACSPPSADDLVQGVMDQRNQYTAELQSWIERPNGSVYLDVLVVNNNTEGSLRTLTVMIELLDADNDVIEARRVPLDVASLTPGLGQNVGVEVGQTVPGLEGVILRVERSVEEELWSEFPEFDAVRPRI